MSRKRPAVDDLIATVAERTGHVFRDAALLERALTHSSARSGEDYQRLEFLGDRVLGLVVADMIFATFPDAPEGELSLRLNALVNAEILAEIGDEVGLSALIQTGSEIRSLQGRKGVNLRADVMEALIAAIYLEGGLDVARAFIWRYWSSRSLAAGAARRDSKTALQEWAHRVSGAAPDYVVESRDGPDHDPLFTVSARIAGYEPGTGQGRSKREAEQAAATRILEREGVWDRAGVAS